MSICAGLVLLIRLLTILICRRLPQGGLSIGERWRMVRSTRYRSAPRHSSLSQLQDPEDERRCSGSARLREGCQCTLVHASALLALPRRLPLGCWFDRFRGAFGLEKEVETQGATGTPIQEKEVCSLPGTAREGGRRTCCQGGEQARWSSSFRRRCQCTFDCCQRCLSIIQGCCEYKSLEKNSAVGEAADEEREWHGRCKRPQNIERPRRHGARSRSVFGAGRD
jgi:hypothetical protein